MYKIKMNEKKTPKNSYEKSWWVENIKAIISFKKKTNIPV